MLEYAEKRGGDVLFYRSVSPGENVTPVGGDVRRGEVVLRKGTVLNEFDLAMLAAFNVQFVKVMRRPFVGILSIGSELVALGEEPSPGKKVCTNDLMISLSLKKFGLTPMRFGIVKDDLEEIKKAIEVAVKLSDALILTGGTAVSGEDLTYKALSELGDVIIRGIAIRPGRHTGFAKIDGKPVFALSGNPVACAIGLLFFSLPVMGEVFRLRTLRMPRVRAKLTRRVKGYPGYRSFIRVKLSVNGGEMRAAPVSVHGSGILSTLTKADGFLIIPEDVEGYEKGTEVEIIVYRGELLGQKAI